MASDLTPDRRAFLRDTANLESGIVLVAKEELHALLDMAERCADYDRRLPEVMPKDFKDWHQNSRQCWPEAAAGVVTNLRGRPAIELTNDERDAMKAPGVYAVDGRIVGVVDATATPVGRMVRMSAKPAGIKP